MESELSDLRFKFSQLRKNAPPVVERVIHGTVKWFNVRKGFGFITREDTGSDVFIHKTGILKNNPTKLIPSLGDGESVTFDIGFVPGRSPEALNVTGPNSSYVKGSHHSPYKYVPPHTTIDHGDDILDNVVPGSLDSCVSEYSTKESLQSISEDEHTHDHGDCEVVNRNDNCDKAVGNDVTELTPHVCASKDLENDAPVLSDGACISSTLNASASAKLVSSRSNGDSDLLPDVEPGDHHDRHYDSSPPKKHRSSFWNSLAMMARIHLYDFNIGLPDGR